MNCDKTRQNISALIDGELSGKEREKTKAHLSTCQTCQATFKYYQQMQNVVDARIAQQSAPVYIARTLSAKINQYKQEQTKKRGFRGVLQWTEPFLFTVNPWARTAQLAGVFIFSLFMGLQLYRTLTPQSNMAEADGTDPENTTAIVQNSTKNNTASLEQDLHNLIENSSLVLNQVNNTTTQQSPQMLLNEKKLAKQLIFDSKLVSNKITGTQYSHLQDLFRDLEPIFLDVANFDHKRDQRSLELIRQQIHNNNYIMKLELAKSTNR